MKAKVDPNKQLTGKQLGLPEGYRLTKDNSENIVYVATKRLYGYRLIKHIYREATIFKMIMNAAYPETNMKKYSDAVKKVSRGDCDEIFKENSILKVRVNGDDYKIGSSGYTWSNNSFKYGIMQSAFMHRMFANMTANELEKVNVIQTSTEGNINTWINNNCTGVLPQSAYHVISKKGLYDCLNAAEKKRLIRFLEASKKLTEEIEDKLLLIRRILATYTSAIKLCNDAPEFIEYINDSAVFNKDGRKCTDVTTADLITQLRKK